MSRFLLRFYNPAFLMVWYPVPLTKTLTEKRELNAPKSHANKKKPCASKNRTCAHDLEISASLVCTRWYFSIVGGLLFSRIGHNVVVLKYYTATNDKQNCSLQSPFEPTFPICCYQCDFVTGIYK